MRHQRDIDHGGFVKDERIELERCAAGAEQQAVDGGGIHGEARQRRHRFGKPQQLRRHGLLQPFGGLAGGRRQRDPFRLCEARPDQQRDEPRSQRRLARAGAAGDHTQAALHGCPSSLAMFGDRRRKEALLQRLRGGA